MSSFYLGSPLKNVVPLVWSRGDGQNLESSPVLSATWDFRSNAHYLRYYEEAQTEERSTFVIRQDAVTVIRRGAYLWNCTFVSGQKQSSTLYLGGEPYSVEVRTRQLLVDVNATGGQVQLYYSWDFSGEDSDIYLQICFGSCVVRRKQHGSTS